MTDKLRRQIRELDAEGRFNEADELRHVVQEIEERAEDFEPGWHWRNCRSVGIEISFWIWPWAFSADRDEDVYGGSRWLNLGPITLKLSYSIGSPDNGGLSETEAWNRAMDALVEKNPR